MDHAIKVIGNIICRSLDCLVFLPLPGYREVGLLVGIAIFLLHVGLHTVGAPACAGDSVGILLSFLLQPLISIPFYHSASIS